MSYCPTCGSELIKKVDGIDGEVDYCPKCQKFIYPTFNTAISTICMQENKVLLIKQYGRDDYILVAGYVTKGEDCKQTLIREVKEEVNLEVVDFLYNDNFYYERSNTLIHNYISYVNGDIVLTDEVDEATFFDVSTAYQKIKPSSLAKKFFFLGMIKLQLLKELVVFSNHRYELCGPNEELIAYNDGNFILVNKFYEKYTIDIQHALEVCYNRDEGDNNV